MQAYLLNERDNLLRLLLINPNTTRAMTEKAASLGRVLLGERIAIQAETGRFGPRYIASRSSFAIASHAALDVFAEHGAGCDAVLLACFGDPGLDAMREVASIPVIGLIEASVYEAATNGRRFSIVTGGLLWEQMLRETLMLKGLAQGLASIRTVAPDGGMIARDPAGALALLREACEVCVREDGAEAVILGGVGLVGLAEDIQRETGIPVICSVLAGFRAVEMALADHRPVPTVDRKAVASIGLSEALAQLLAKGAIP